MSSCQPIMDFTVASCSVFGEGDRRRPSSVHSILEIVVATMVLIDAASNDDSNGGHIVISSNLVLCCEIPAVGLNSAELGGK